MPYWLACTISALTLLLSVLACELALGRRLHADLTDALAAVLHFLVDGIAAFAVTALATGVRLRVCLQPPPESAVSTGLAAAAAACQRGCLLYQPTLALVPCGIVLHVKCAAGAPGWPAGPPRPQDVLSPPHPNPTPFPHLPPPPQVIKMSVGRLRPDFLARCQPVVPNPLTVQYGLPASDNPACQVAPSGELTDGHYRCEPMHCLSMARHCRVC